MQKRDPLMVVLLTFITFGIYGLYWIYSTREEMIREKANIPPFWLLLLPMLLFVAALLQMVMSFITQGGTGTVAVTNAAMIMLGLAALIGIPYSLFFMYRYCGGVQKVTRRRMDQMSCFLLFIVLTILSSAFSTGHGGIVVFGGVITSLWFGYMQHGFNKYVKS